MQTYYALFFLARLALRGHGAGGSGRDSAVDQQSLSGNVAALLRCKKNDGAIQIAGHTGPLQRNAVAQILHPFRIVVEDFILLGLEPSGREQLTVTPCLPHSSARLMVNWRMPPRLAV